MEEELLGKVRAYVERAERRLREGRLDAAYDSYMDALRAIAGYLVYRDSGMLLSGEELMGIIVARYGKVYSIIRRYEGVTEMDEETLRALKSDTKDLMERVLPKHWK
ncbi:hypothetical protein [Thermococcus sp.]|uniref:hypothetical protein n=1 Tax=Thermococcus sp. TaxID=35749 RepID=UPI002638F222|nr:hypothetical protein [Thermococcus sp.]